LKRVVDRRTAHTSSMKDGDFAGQMPQLPLLQCRVDSTVFRPSLVETDYCIA
jgi:hypothetical protein